MGIFGKSKGSQCETQEDGTLVCRTFENTSKGRVATGTQVTIAADAENGCEPYIAAGVNSINEDDIDALKNPMAQAKQACLRGGMGRKRAAQ